MPSAPPPSQHTNALRAARALGRRHHWRLAARLASGITTNMLHGWFQEFFMEGERIPASPRRRILWLVEVRAAFRARHDSLSCLLVSAAIWRETDRLKRQRQAHRKLLAVARTARTARGQRGLTHAQIRIDAKKIRRLHSQNS